MDFLHLGEFLVQKLWVYEGNIRLCQEQPLCCVFSEEDWEIDHEIDLDSFELFFFAKFLFKIESSHEKSIEYLLLRVVLFQKPLLFELLLGVETGPDDDFELSQHHLLAHESHVLDDANAVYLI